MHQLRRLRTRVPEPGDRDGEEIYEIDPKKCTECVGHFDEPQCVQVCPVACIPVDPQRVETRELLWFKYRQLIAGQATRDAL